MDYLVATTVSTDEIHLPDGRVYTNVPGSAGFFALAGIRFFTTQVLVCGAIGPEYLERHGSWFTENQVSTAGLIQRSPITPITVITYFDDRYRVDNPNIGLNEFRNLDPTVDEVMLHCNQKTKGIYVFKHLDVEYLDALIERKKQFGYQLLWEISEDACSPDNIPEIVRLMKDVDVFSISIREAKLLLDVEDTDTILNFFVDHNVHWTYLRNGDEGAFIIDKKMVFACPSFPAKQVKDTTGAGNSSSSAVLYGKCEGFDALYSACLGAAAASKIVETFGVPDHFSTTLMLEVHANAKDLLHTIKGREIEGK